MAKARAKPKAKPPKGIQAIKAYRNTRRLPNRSVGSGLKAAARKLLN